MGGAKSIVHAMSGNLGEELSVDESAIYNVRGHLLDVKRTPDTWDISYSTGAEETIGYISRAEEGWIAQEHPPGDSPGTQAISYREAFEMLTAHLS
jgi:hypothetical protein